MAYIIWAIHGRPADPLFRFLRNGKAGYIDRTGKVVIPPTLPSNATITAEFHEGLAVVSEDEHTRYIDRSGKEAFRTDAWLAFNFSEGLAPAARFDRTPRWGFVDRSGKFAVPPSFDRAEGFSEGLALVKVSNLTSSTGYIDHSGTFVIQPTLTFGSSFHEGLAPVVLDGPCRITNGGSCMERPLFTPMKSDGSYDCRYSYIDKSGTPISPLRFDDAEGFSEGLAAVRIGKHWGYIDKSLRIVIQPQFDEAESFSEGLAAVWINGRAGYIDRTGNLVITPQFEIASSFSDGRGLVGHFDGERSVYRYIGKEGEQAFPGTFAVASDFSYGLADVQLPNKKFAWIDTTGKPVMIYRAK